MSFFKGIKQVRKCPKDVIKKIDLFGNVRYYTPRFIYEPFINCYGENVYLRCLRHIDN